MPKKQTLIKHSVIFATYLIVVWGFYRLLFKLPDEIEEIIIKPIIWIIPVLFLSFKEKGGFSSLGITTKNLFPAIYFALGVGSIFVIEALVTNYIKYDGFKFSANIGDQLLLASLGISFLTALSEELAFRGYLFNRLWKVLDKEWLANLLITLVWVLIHVPITIFVRKLGFADAALYLSLTAVFGFGSAFVFARTGNVFSSIFLHVLWEWPIILFR
jgi:membrane protease YdiL (CAAX protease family)